MSRNISIVRWYPELEKHRCGYCKQTNSNCSYGMWAESLTVEDYQYLIDRGWRRSGKYCYKPVMDVTCCPLYTIRCEALNLRVSKSQKKIIKRVNRFLSGDSTACGSTDADELQPSNDDDNGRMDTMMTMSVDHCSKLSSRNVDLGKLDSEQINMIISNRNDNADALNEDNDTFTPNEQTLKSSVNDKSGDKYKPGMGADPNKPPCKKAKLLRLERKQQKLAAKGLTNTSSVKNAVDQQQTKTLEDFINDVSKKPSHKLKVCLVLTSGKKDWTEIKAQEYEVYKKYQMAIHGDPADKCTERQFQSFLLESPLQIILKEMNSNEETFLESAKLFSKYQMVIHNETENECDVDTFKDFLVETPLKHINDGTEHGYGSFHQQYWLDDKLIAVGVIDILPKCVSSVYFFYDPDYRNLTLGTYGSLRELYFVRELNEKMPTIKYYYLGFYIHSCPKMRYKSKFSPSYLLCPETYVWFPMDHCIPKLDAQKYCRFNEDIDAIDKNACTTIQHIENLMILNCYKGCVPFKYLKDKIQDHEDFIRFGNLIGKKCVPRIVMVAYD